MNEIGKYLENRLKFCSRYQLRDLDKNYLENNSIADFIFKKVISKRFRKWRINEVLKKKVKEAIKLNIRNNEPIRFIFPFGGYKLWRLPTSPEVDWAEFFAISYYCEYISSILQVYEPGVNFIFCSIDFIVERMDNIPKKDTDAYFNSFKQLLEIFLKYFPGNANMGIMKISDLYKKEELESELSFHIKEFEQNFLKQDKERVKKLLESSQLNIKMKGVRDWTKLSSEEQQEKIKMGVVFHEAQHNLIKRKNFVDGKDKIRLSAVRIQKAVPVGTTKTSVTKFWTGFGVLEKNGDKLKDRVFSPKQLEKLNEFKVETKKIDLIPLRNFEEIKVIIK